MDFLQLVAEKTDEGKIGNPEGRDCNPWSTKNVRTQRCAPCFCPQHKNTRQYAENEGKIAK